MKKMRFAILAIFVAIVAFMSTNAISAKSEGFTTVYAFDASNNFLASGTYADLDNNLCPGSGHFCAHVWTGITQDEKPTGTQLTDIQKQ